LAATKERTLETVLWGVDVSMRVMARRVGGRAEKRIIATREGGYGQVRRGDEENERAGIRSVFERHATARNFERPDSRLRGYDGEGGRAGA
jgi:hypothetical protein